MSLSNEAKARRLQYVTGSDCSIVCGVSKYCTPFTLWEYKTKRRTEDDISEKPHVKAGIMLEDAVRDWLAEAIDKDIKHDDEFRIHANYPWMGATIDGYILDSDSRITAIVEVKTASSDEGWGDSGSNIIPESYRLQVAHYMAVTDCDICYVGVLIRGVDFRHYVIYRDMDLEEYIICREMAFYECMSKDIPPNPETYEEVVRYYLDHDKGLAVHADQSIEDLCVEYKALSQSIAEYEALKEQVKVKLCSFMGDADTLVGGNGRIWATWRARNGQRRIDTETLKKIYPGIAEECTKVGNPTRVFDLKL